MTRLVFVKLGGSVITDKGQPETARPAVIARLAGEIATALASDPDLRMVLGHGSGSFGHVSAGHYRTRQGVRTDADWRGFAQVAAVAARLNRLVVDALLAAGVPAWSLQPSASARCREGELESLEVAPIEEALSHGLVPLVYGDVALDDVQGATIISTEQIFGFLARQLNPTQIVLVGVVDGVYEQDPLRVPSAPHIPQITAENWAQVRRQLGGSYATDVTGGMLSKVEEMVGLVHDLPGLAVLLMSGERAGALQTALLAPDQLDRGTRIHQI